MNLVLCICYILCARWVKVVGEFGLVCYVHCEVRKMQFLADFLYILIVVGEGMTFYTYFVTAAVFKYCAVCFLLLF